MSVASETPRPDGATVPQQGSTTILVCTRCNWTGRKTECEGARSGAALLHLLRASASPPLRVQPVACLSGCKRACAIGVMARGKVSYLFGDLAPTHEAAAEITAFARQHAEAKTGWLMRPQRPPRLRGSILARLPPLDWARDGEIIWPA